MTNEDRIKEINDNFDYCVKAWEETRREGAMDMKYISGDPWDSAEKESRTKTGRLALVLDELNQYNNQIINNVRMNKRAIKFNATGEGANDKKAAFRQALARQIEYKSKAQQAYITAFENAVQRSYGYFRIKTQYISDDGFDQEIAIGRIPNPDSIYLDPDAKEADFSDMKFAFSIDFIRKEQFKSDYPNAQIHDFTSEHQVAAPHWIKDKHIQVAEYWKVNEKKQWLYLLDTPERTKIYHNALPKGTKVDRKEVTVTWPSGRKNFILNMRETVKRKIVKYITNGVEILEEVDWPGKWIPIVPVWGKEIYVDTGGGSKRILLSATRLARDPYMLYCYYRTCEAELVSMTPKTPYIGYEGQFDGQKEKWQNVNRVPQAYLEVKPVLDATGQAVLPLPKRQEYVPQIAPLEMGAESAKRAIQAAFGMHNASVGKLDGARQSGVAIDKLDTQSDQGSHHFIDNYDRAIQHGGAIVVDLFPIIIDTQRSVGIRQLGQSSHIFGPRISAI